jgi:ribonucleotide monophosphatase NagD (HAD superfamily)
MSEGRDAIRGRRVFSVDMDGAIYRGNRLLTRAAEFVA